MKIEKAYSLDCNEVIDAELAYDYYWNEKISNPQNFECPSADCSTSITCANLYKLRQNMKVDPYYKAIGEHSKDCTLEKDITNKRKKAAAQSKVPSRSKNNKSNGTADLFMLERPKSHWEREQAGNLIGDPTTRKNRKRSIKSKAYDDYFSPSRYFSLVPIISKFFRFKQTDKLDNTYIKINGFEISYKEMFIKIQGQELLSLPEDPRIFYSEAFVNKSKGDSYLIRFANELKNSDSLIKPTFFITQNQLEKSFSKKVKKAKFEDLSKNRSPTILAFIYGKPLFKDNQYINFSLKNIDLFDFRKA
ncbi:MAG: hypothetical protein GY710_14000 [Desulfobacteraceae bacterium]|nr:hypothetical protein [Desulfobacteraceae bacterium]